MERVSEQSMVLRSAIMNLGYLISKGLKKTYSKPYVFGTVDNGGITIYIGGRF